MSITINENKIKQVINNFNFFEPYFEDEIPNTYPVPNYNNWDIVDDENYTKLLSDINQNGDKNISSLYISIPYCSYRCTYCVYNIHVGGNNKKKYLNILSEEMDLYKENLKIKYEHLKRIYIGGGTPSILTLEQLKELFKILTAQEIKLNNLESFTFELSPETIDEEKLNFLIDNGVNRFSIGIQDIHENILKIVTRNTSKDQIINALALLNQKVTYYNVDLIYGLPEQKVNDWEETLNTLIKYNVPEFTLYNLRIGRKTKLKNLNLSLHDEKKLFKIATDILSDKNYKQVRPFHWVRDEDIKKLWQKYKYAPFSDQHAKKGPGMELGIGASAVSHIKDIIFKNYDINYHSDEKTLSYFEKINRGKLPIESVYRVNDYDKVIRHLLYGVENGYIDINNLNEKERKIAKQFTDLENKFLKHNLISKKGNKLYLTNLGKLFYNNIEKEISFTLRTFDEKYKISTILSSETINEVCKSTLDCSKDSNLKILELGSGIGSISIPIILGILKGKTKKVNIVKWEAIELDNNKIEYYKQKLIDSTDSIPKIKYNYKNGNEIIINNEDITINLTFKNFDIEREVVNEKFKSKLKFEKYDIVFMPSFLNHIIFWKQVLFTAFDILKVNGLLVLGYPNGAWSIPEYGPTSFYDFGNQQEWIDFWQQFYKIYPNFYLFFRLPFNEMSSILEENVLEFVKINGIKLNKPSLETLQRFCNKGYFSFCENIYPEDSVAEKIIKLEEIIGNNSFNLDKLDDFKFTFELIKKKSDIKNIQNQLSYNIALTSKNIDPEIYSINVKERNKLLIYGIVRTILGEGVLDKVRVNSKDKKNTIVGSYVGNRLDKVLENQFIPDVVFFSEPKPYDIKILHNYMCFYSTEKTIPITKILTDFLPKKYPLKNYLVFKYKVGNEIKIKTWADEDDGILYIEIQITEVFLGKNILINQEKVENKPKKLYKKGNEIIAFPYNEKIKINDSSIDEYLNEKIDDDDNLNIVDFFLEDPKLKEEYKGKKENEIRNGIIKRLLILAHTFLNMEVHSSIGIPIKGFLGNESRLIGVIWLVYNDEWGKIKSKELVYIKKFQNNILVPIVSKLNLILLGLAKNKLDVVQLKTSIISILVDSFSHNISAHSLAALKWWFEQRSKVLDKRFKVYKDGTLLNCIKPCIISIDQKNTLATTEKYYDTLGLTDSTYNKEYYSLFDFLQFGDKNGNDLKDIFSFTSKVKTKYEKFHPRFPVPIDYALCPFFRFLRDKGAFWSGVTRDMTFGGETKTWYKVLWEDFANNPLYLGTIAKSEVVTKLNIHLKVKNGNEWIEGNFLTIDMSIMDNESDIVEKEDVENSNAVPNDVKSSNENTSVDKPINYTNYAFVKLGEKFSSFRKILNDENKFNVFLPGGVVGEHALFTIFENTIRNIKHYKDEDTLKEIKENGIDFWISIEEEFLAKNTEHEDDNKNKQLFKIGVWLNHKTLLVKKERNDSDEEEERYLLFDITEQTLKPILDESNGMPRMGGNSQDKACAAMLFNNNFSSVENKKKDRDREYYPWLRFATVNTKEYLLNIKYDTDDTDVSKLKKDYSSSYLCNGREGMLKKYFYMWQGKDYLDKSVLESGDWENPARAKFLVSNEKWEDKDIVKARENGIIRFLKTNNTDINQLYKEWLIKWCEIENTSEENILLGLKVGQEENNLSAAGATRLKSDNLYHYSFSSSDDYGDSVVLKLSHGEEKGFHCNVRSHGAFFQKFFKGVEIKTVGNFILNCNENKGKITYNTKIDEKFKKNEVLLSELIETVLTKIVIFDNRVKDRFKSFSKEKMKMFKEQLLLKVYEEKEEAWEKFLDNSTDQINFLVIHLSFIESLGYSEDKIDEFMEDKLAEFIKRENFIFVLTSGRGRDKWRESIKNIECKKLTIFKPIESILTSVENGISYNDHFDVKYHLVKTLFGS